MSTHLTDQQLIDYQFDLASEADAKTARTHLEKCETCRRRLHDLARKLNALDLLRDDVKASRTLLSETIRNAQRAGRWRKLIFRRLPWMGAVAAAVVVGIALLAVPDRNLKDVALQSSAPERSLEIASTEGLIAADDSAEAKDPVRSVPVRAYPETPDGVTTSALADAPGTAQPDATGGIAKAFGLGDGLLVSGEDHRQAALDAATRRAAVPPGTAIDEQPPFAPASAIELVVLPRRENVQLTIYNAADLTLVRERRNLTLKRGWNWLQFMWANTLIDPTSLSLEPLEHKDQVQVQQLVFPPRLRELGRWLIRSEIDGQVPFELTYFTSGLSWRAFYMGTLSQDEKTMRLEGYVRVTNLSGEDYEAAQTRLLVGRVHLLERMKELAQRPYPYGGPDYPNFLDRLRRAGGEEAARLRGQDLYYPRVVYAVPPKEIRKEGLSEYFLYTIEGTETIPDQWGRRLLSFEASDIPVTSLCKYDEERWGDRTIRFLSFANDEEHKLGETPLPDGTVRIYGRADNQRHLSYVGGMDVKYIPVGDEVELNLGAARLVEVKPVLIDYRTTNHTFDARGEVSGWDEVRSWKIEVVNAGTLPVRVEVTRGFETSYWTLKMTGGDAAYRKHDATHARFELTVPARQTQVFEYEVTTYHGVREQSFVNRDPN